MGRLQFQQMLEGVMTDAEEDPDHVYFQPGPNITMEYPCIVYRRDSADVAHADNRAYRRSKRYQVTVIDEDPDSVIPEKVADLPMSFFERFFTKDQLNHDVYNIFFDERKSE